MFNKVILMGRLTAEPEQKQTPNGISVTAFSLAVERNFAGKDGKRDTDFIRVVAWRSTAEFICRYFTKGQMMALEGSIQTRNYEDKQGTKRTVFEVVADQVYFAGGKPSEKSASPSANAGEGFSVGDFEEIPTDNGDLPF